ncbi:MAG: hypothetical protein H6686_00800 [Fibrobacteria bacterium]|nr:hypothetical protein [Fibrobacteria bacterium]
MKSLSILLLTMTSLSFAQYDDYPVGEYEYPHHRIVISPLKVFGGMDATKRDEGPKVDLIWVPGVDLQEIRYEYVGGPQGTYAFGPLFSLYLGMDSVKATSFAGGMYGRIYSGLGSGSYIQMSAQYYLQTGTKLFDGQPRDIYVVRNGKRDTVKLAPTEVKVSGPQMSPVLGIQKIYDRRWLIEGQMGFTVGWYTVDWDAPSTFEIDRTGSVERYQTTDDWGGFYFVQIGLGYAF